MIRLCSAWLLVAALLACPARPPSAADAGPAAAAARPPTHSTLQRPPYPNMATAVYGQRVLDEKLQTPPLMPAKLEDVLQALHEMSPGSEQRAADLALAAYKSAANDAQRGTALALHAAALVLEPTVEGYKERLTDAFGLANYAATVDAGDAVGQAARSLVDAAAGATEQARRLVQVVNETPKVAPDVRLFLALTRKASGARETDAVIDDLRAAVAHRPTGARARALLAELLLDLGLVDQAIAVASDANAKDASGNRAPWLLAIEGRALVLAGKPAEGIALLREAEGKLDEGRRGDVLYWLGRSLSQSDAWQTEVPPIAASLTTRAGFGKEARTLEALTALLGGDPQKARALLEPLVKGPAQLAVDVDLSWLLVDACAGAGDGACVEEHGRRAVALDGDAARLSRARAQALLMGSAAPDGTVDAGPGAPAGALAEARREAHRLSPFDDQLGALVKEPIVPGGAKAALSLRAARKALIRGAPKIAVEAASSIAGCRACAAVAASAKKGKDASDAALHALALPPSAGQLALLDLLDLVHALGAFPDKKAAAALDVLAKDPRPPVKAAVESARADLKDPDARKRKDAER